MLTVAYCRVSTEEQAAEGFSIAGQADKLRVYVELHDLGGDGDRRPRALGQEPRAARPAATAAHGRRRARGQRADVAARPAVSEPERSDPVGRSLRTGRRGLALVHGEDRSVVGDGPHVLQHPRLFCAVLPRTVGRERAHGHAAGRAPGQVGQPSQDGLCPRRRGARRQRDGSRRPAHLHAADRGPEHRQDRRRHRRQVLDGAHDPQLADLPRRGADERRVVPGATRGDHHPGAVRRRPPGPGQGVGPGAPTCCRAGSAAGSVSA